VPLVIHWRAAPVEAGGAALPLATWFHSAGLPRLARALGHGLEFVPLGAALAPVLALVALLGALALREARMRWTLATALLVPLLFLTAVSAGPFDFYWGALVTPVVLALLPLAFARALPRAEPTPGA
jgi:hypothetical protein